MHNEKLCHKGSIAASIFFVLHCMGPLLYGQKDSPKLAQLVCGKKMEERLESQAIWKKGNQRVFRSKD